MGLCLYGICFWLCIGYGLKGYGTQQYEVLDIATFCRLVNVVWQTDPRRHHFVRLHVILFSFGTVGLLTGLAISIAEFHDEIINLSRWTLFGRKIVNVDVDLSAVKMLQGVIAGCIIIPSFVGMILAATVNGHSFLLLGQQHCYASFVSARFGYLDDYWVNWIIKLSTWFGLNA
jgi:hypothetical protein